MDGTSFIQGEASNSTRDVGQYGFRRAILLTVISAVLTVGVLVGLRMVGAPLPVVNEFATPTVDQ